MCKEVVSLSNFAKGTDNMVCKRCMGRKCVILKDGDMIPPCGGFKDLTLSGGGGVCYATRDAYETVTQVVWQTFSRDTTIMREDGKSIRPQTSYYSVGIDMVFDHGGKEIVVNTEGRGVRMLDDAVDDPVFHEYTRSLIKSSGVAIPNDHGIGRTIRFGRRRKYKKRRKKKS